MSCPPPAARAASPPPAKLAGGLRGWQVLFSLGDSLAVLDRGLRLVWLKEPLLGGRTVGQIMGQPCHLAFFGRKRPCAQDCPVRPVFSQGRPHAVQRHFQGPDGREHWREARAYPVLDGQGQVAFAVRISFDITAPARARGDLDLALQGVERLGVGELPFQASLPDPLSPREIEVLRLAALGLSNPGIARLLGISINTVKRHMAHIFDKLLVNDRSQAAVWAARQGLV